MLYLNSRVMEEVSSFLDELVCGVQRGQGEVPDLEAPQDLGLSLWPGQEDHPGPPVAADKA